MLPESRMPTHPGEMLVEEFLKPKEISQTAFATQLGISLQRVNEIATGKRGVTADTAWRFAAALGTTPQFWMNLQVNYDLQALKPAGLTPTRMPARAAKRMTVHHRIAAKKR